MSSEIGQEGNISMRSEKSITFEEETAHGGWPSQHVVFVTSKLLLFFFASSLVKTDLNVVLLFYLLSSILVLRYNVILTND